MRGRHLMLGALVTVNAHAGTLTRYEIGGQLRKTHHWEVPEEDFPRPVEFGRDVVEEFRKHGHEDYYVGAPVPLPPSPGAPPSPPAAAMAAA